MFVTEKGAIYAHDNETPDVANEIQGWATSHYPLDPYYYVL